MKCQTPPARPGATAIAAVLALTTTPALAQAIVTDPLGAQAPPAADPPAPAPAPSAPDQTVQVAQPSSVPASSSPKLPDLPVAPARAQQQTVGTHTKTAEPAATTKPLHTAPSAPKRWTVTPAPSPAPSTVSPTTSNAPAISPQSGLLEPVPVAAKPVPDLAAAPAPWSSIWLPLGGGLLLAGGGAAFAVTRRRKPRNRVQLRPAAPAPAPAPVRTPVVANTGIEPRKAVGTRAVGNRAVLEAMVAQPPSPENPFHTRKLRLRRAHYLLRTGQASAALPQAPAAPVPASVSATDRWSEMRVAGQSPVRLSWRPVQG